MGPLHHRDAAGRWRNDTNGGWAGDGVETIAQLFPASRASGFLVRRLSCAVLSRLTTVLVPERRTLDFTGRNMYINVLSSN